MKLEIPLPIVEPQPIAGRAAPSVPVDAISRVDEAASYLSVLGQAHRLRIFRLLMQSEYCVCELEESLKISPTLLAHHLKVLRQSGLVQMRRGVTDARWIYYSLKPGAFLSLRDALSGLIGPGDLPPEAQCGSSCSCG